MGTIVIIYEERCGDCQDLVKETSRETEDLFSDPDDGSATVKRRIILRRCKKCQPVFEEKIANLKKDGLVKIIPFGVSGLSEEDRYGINRDFIGRDKVRSKRERGHDNLLSDV